MHISNDIRYIGVNDHQIDLFEGQYIVPNGMAYNSYVIMDEKIAVLDTVDQHFGADWFANLEKELDGRQPDYLVVTWSRTIPRISGALQRSIRMRRSSRLCPPST
jgi:flavorubredoxin